MCEHFEISTECLTAKASIFQVAFLSPYPIELDA